MLKLIVADSCETCSRTKDLLLDFSKQNPEIDFVVENINEQSMQKPCIVPALFINNELFSYGEINNSQLTRVLELLK